MKRCFLLLALFAGCAAPDYEASKVKNDAPALAQTELVSLDSPLEKARWVTFLMDELYALRRANEDGLDSDYKIALVLEIASYDSYTLRIAAEAMDAIKDDGSIDFWSWSIFDRYTLTNLICNVRLDHESRTDEDGRTIAGWPVMIEDGKLEIADHRITSWSGPMIFDLTNYRDGKTIHQWDVEYYGLRDLAPYGSQCLTEDQFDELRAKYAAWDGDVFVPDEPAEPHYEDQSSGYLRHPLGTVRSIENEHAFSALRAAQIMTSAYATGGTTHISVIPDDLERARNVVRADAEKHGYAFRE